MPRTVSVRPTHNAYQNGLLTGTKWATHTLTFSFPTNSAFYGSHYGSGEQKYGFEAFNSAQKAAVYSILDMYASDVNLHFVEATESSSQHATLRFAETNRVQTAWGYYPHTSSEAGDMWFNNSKGYYDDPVKGNYAWLTMIHEFGHALGLKHAHEAMGSFGRLPLGVDSLEYTVMTYRSYVGASTNYYTNGHWSYPQTLMMYDIAALQRLYGPNWTTNNGDTVYEWNPQTGEMSVDGMGQGAPGGQQDFHDGLGWRGKGHIRLFQLRHRSHRESRGGQVDNGFRSSARRSR